MTIQVQKLKEINVVTKFKTKPILDNTKKRIGILGGTFNPPHLGHLIIADQVCQQLGLSEVRFMPDATPPHVDKKEAIDAKYRLDMVNQSIADNDKFKLEDTEINRGGISYTYDTVVALKAAHPENDYYFIIGGDMVDYLPKWSRIDELVKLVHFVGVKRTGFEQTSQYPILWVDVPTIDISSTQIRDKIKKGCSINYLVPKTVSNYIEKEGLYRE